MSWVDAFVSAASDCAGSPCRPLLHHCTGRNELMKRSKATSPATRELITSKNKTWAQWLLGLRSRVQRLNRRRLFSSYARSRTAYLVADLGSSGCIMEDALIKSSITSQRHRGCYRDVRTSQLVSVAHLRTPPTREMSRSYLPCCAGQGYCRIMATQQTRIDFRSDFMFNCVIHLNDLRVMYAIARRSWRQNSTSASRNISANITLVRYMPRPLFLQRSAFEGNHELHEVASCVKVVSFLQRFIQYLRTCSRLGSLSREEHS